MSLSTFLIRDLFHIVNEGYSAAWLIYLFFWGAYIRKFGFQRLTRSKAIVIIIICVIANFVSYKVLHFLLHGNGKELLLYRYSSPTILAISLCIVYLFAYQIRINIHDNRFIRWLSSVSLSVYIIHAHPFSLDYMMYFDKLSMIGTYQPAGFLLAVISAIVVIYFVCGVFDSVRTILFKVFKINNAEDKLGKLIKSTILNVSSKI